MLSSCKPIRVVFMGTPDFAVPSLRALSEQAEQFHVVAVLTQPDKPAGRGRKLTASPVRRFAEAQGIPVHTPTKLKAAATRELIASLEPTVCVVAAYGRILPVSLLELPPGGCVNVHASLLPRHRGASPIAHAIKSGDTQTGVCIMNMDAGLDTGPVYACDTIPIADDDTCGTLTPKLAELGAELLTATLPRIVRGACIAVAQDDAASSYAPLLKKEDGWLHFERPAGELVRLIRGLNPWPGTAADKGGLRVQVLRAHDASADQPGTGTHGDCPVGTVLRADQRGILVRCGQGVLCLDAVKPAGKRAMAASAWVAGRGVAVGDRFVAPAAPAVRFVGEGRCIYNEEM